MKQQRCVLQNVSMSLNSDSLWTAIRNTKTKIDDDKSERDRGHCQARIFRSNGTIEITATCDCDKAEQTVKITLWKRTLRDYLNEEL